MSISGCVSSSVSLFACVGIGDYTFSVSLEDFIYLFHITLETVNSKLELIVLICLQHYLHHITVKYNKIFVEKNQIFKIFFLISFIIFDNCL